MEIHSAWSAVGDYIRSVVERAGHTIGCKQGKRHPIHVDMRGITVDMDCYFDPNTDFEVVRDKSGQWP